MKKNAQIFLLIIAISIFSLSVPVHADKPVITVSDVNELYSVVNDPVNKNVKVQLVASTYMLDASYPNGGRLVLQPGMDLIGKNEYEDLDGDGVWDPLNGEIPTPTSNFVVFGTETIIDGIGISSADIDQGDLIVVGHNNLVEKLTIKNMPYGGKALVGSSGDSQNSQGNKKGWKFGVTDCLLENNSDTGLAEMGVDCVNRGSELNGANTRCTLTGNIVRNLPNIGDVPDGIRIRNDGANNTKINAILKHNRAYSIPGRVQPPTVPEAGHALAVYGTYPDGGDNNYIRTVSIGNIYADCGVGVVIFGSFQFFTNSSGNRVHVTSNKDQIINNYTEGGAVITGAFPIVGNSYDNEANVKMLGTIFVSDNGQPENMTEGGDRRDLIAFGASGFLGIEEVVGNKASLLLRGAESDGFPSFIIFDNDPDNKMELIGSETAIENANDGVDLLIFE